MLLVLDALILTLCPKSMVCPLLGVKMIPEGGIGLTPPEHPPNNKTSTSCRHTRDRFMDFPPWRAVFFTAISWTDGVLGLGRTQHGPKGWRVARLYYGKGEVRKIPERRKNAAFKGFYRPRL